MLSQFSFASKSTLLAASLRSIQEIFETARLTLSSGSDTLQICFVISDARIDSDNRLSLNSIMRDLAEKHILVVLVIMDCTDDAENSIFVTKVVEFTPTGISTFNYLENFPFPYYVVIQHMDSLPDVLSGALKQWFEMVLRN